MVQWDGKQLADGDRDEYFVCKIFIPVTLRYKKGVSL